MQGREPQPLSVRLQTRAHPKAFDSQLAIRGDSSNWYLCQLRKPPWVLSSCATLCTTSWSLAIVTNEVPTRGSKRRHERTRIVFFEMQRHVFQRSALNSHFFEQVERTIPHHKHDNCHRAM